MLIFGPLVALPAVAAIAFPIFLLLWRLRFMSLWHVLLGAVFSSLLALAILSFSFGSAPSTADTLSFCYIGACAGAVFWLSGIRGNEP